MSVTELETGKNESEQTGWMVTIQDKHNYVSKFYE